MVDALAHPWLSSYHDVNDEPECPELFEKWRQIEQLETLDQFREALWREIEEYRKEVRGIGIEVDYMGRVIRSGSSAEDSRRRSVERREARVVPDSPEIPSATAELTAEPETVADAGLSDANEQPHGVSRIVSPTMSEGQVRPLTPTDPVVQYARRSSIMGISRQNSTTSSPMVPRHQPLPSYTEGSVHAEPGSSSGVVFPTYGRTESYILPARSRTASMVGGEASRKLLRTLSTVSIHESIEGLPGGLESVSELGKYIMGKQTAGADAPPSEMPKEFGFEDGEGDFDDDDESPLDKKKGGKFQL